MPVYKTITSANSTYTLLIAGLFPVPQRLHGYSADAAFDTESNETAEAYVGVDGEMSAGYLPYLTRQTISLAPDSDSNDLIETWAQAEKAVKEKYFASAVISLPAVNRSYIMTKGVLSSYVSVPSARKVLQPRSFMIIWGSVAPVPVSVQ